MVENREIRRDSKDESRVEQIREEKYTPFRARLQEGEEIFLSDPSRWWRGSYRFIRRIQQDARNNPEQFPEEMTQFIEDYSEGLLNVLKEETTIVPPEAASRRDLEDFRSERAQTVMHDMSHFLMDDEPVEESPMEVNHISMDDLLNSSERFRIQEIDGKSIFQIYSHEREEFIDYPLPQTYKVMHKGGFPRTVLKILAGAPDKLIESELPPNDFDVLALNDPEAMSDAVSMGIEPDGIELIDDFNMPEIMNNRDLDINGCFIGKDGLTYSTQSIKAAESGKVSIVATKRGIYGSEIFFYDGTRLIKNRGVMRYLKTITEEKALSFDFLPMNEQIDLGIYWLILAKRFSTKPNAAELLDKLYYLGKEINQVREGEENILDVLNRVHSKYPFYDFDGKPLNKVGLSRWLNRKFMKQVDKKYRDRNHIPSGLIIERQPEDTEPYTVSLENYHRSDDAIAHIKSGWNRFLQASRNRNEEYKESIEDQYDTNGE